MSISKDSYHHGDLKNALIEAGVRLLAEGGEAGLSLRALAREVGVSHNAPYMHFADKQAVLAAIAEQGFQLLGEAIDASQIGLSDVSMETRLIAVAHSYVHFALKYPNHVMVMFGKLTASDYPELLQTSRATFDKLVQIMRDGRQAGAMKDFAPEHLALLVWMNVHGLSALLIAEKIPEQVMLTLSSDDLTTRSVQMICQGILT